MGGGHPYDEREPVPTYQYVCTECTHPLEAQQSFTDSALRDCPQCEGTLRKVFSAVGVVFKGSGFYRNDSRAPRKDSETGGDPGTKSDGSKGSDSSGDSAGSGSTGSGSTGSKASTGGDGSGSGSASKPGSGSGSGERASSVGSDKGSAA